METNIKKVTLDNVTLIYAIRDGVVSFTPVPNSKVKDVKEIKLIKGQTKQYPYIDSMIQLASRNEQVFRNFSQSQTLFNSASGFYLKWKDQEIKKSGDITEVITTLEGSRYLVKHHVVTHSGYKAFETFVEVKNITNKDQFIDRFDSFAINTLSPFMEENDNDHLILHEFGSYWSMECRKHSRNFDEYDFYDSWSKLGLKVHRIGALGLMTARGYIPFMAVSDTKNDVTWAVQYSAGDSWQMEAVFNYGAVNLVGGHSDYLNGHWEKKLNPGETFITAKAYIAAVEGNLDRACMHLTRYHDFLLEIPEKENDMPIIFNEYLSTWGQPDIDNVSTELKLAKEMGAEEFVIDAGWYAPKGLYCEGLLGDWVVNKERFPNGLKEFSKKAEDLGFHTHGIWYEFESVTTNSNLYKEHPEYLATLNGEIVNLDIRCFLDFNKPEAVQYLRDTVLKNLKENHVNYIKLDYNENIGYEIDGENENKAENIRTHSEKVRAFIKELQREVPDLVFETCSSGGMRHSLSFNYIGSMNSFSDAHETLGGIPISMDMHRIMQPRVMQIWASLLPSHDLDQIYSVVAKGMLGRLCYSGRPDLIKPECLKVAKEGTEFYKRIKHIIRDGNTINIDTDEIKSVDKIHGVCSLTRVSQDEKEMLFYVFKINDSKRVISSEIKGYKLEEYFGNSIIKNGNIDFQGKEVACFVGKYRKV